MHCFQAGRATEKRMSISCACVYNCVCTVQKSKRFELQSMHVVRIGDPLQIYEWRHLRKIRPRSVTAYLGSGVVHYLCIVRLPAACCCHERRTRKCNDVTVTSDYNVTT